MATDSFKFWDAYYKALKLLDTNEQRGEFVMGLCEYVFDGAEPTFSDPKIEFGFSLIADQARQSKELSAASREYGKRGGRPRKDTSKKGGVKGGLKPSPKGVPKANRYEMKGRDSINKNPFLYENEYENGVPSPSASASAGTPYPTPHDDS